MTTFKTLLFTAAISASFTPALLAHHGSQFITLHDFDIGHAGDGHALFNFELEDSGDEEELSSGLALFFSPISRVGLGTELRFAEEADDWDYSSVTPSFQVQITDPHQDWWLDIGFSLGYQFASGNSHDEPGDEEHEHAEHGHAGDEHAHEETAATHRHSGIHNHEVDQWLGRLILETEVGKTKLTGNLISTYPEGDRAYWGYGIGARRPIGQGFALGVEAIGDFDSGGEHEIVTSLHYRISDRATARFGVGFGLTDESPDHSLHAGLVWKF